jgi:hypothetical protein
MSLFKQGSCEKDLFEGMQKATETAETQENTQQEKLILEAMEELNEAAKKFEKAGLIARAKDVTKVMISVAGKR